MKRILGLDLGTNSIGWALIEQDFDNKEGSILRLGSRIIPMSQDVLGKFDSGLSHSQTEERTGYRGVRRLYQRDNLRRERLHRVLNILGFLPKHYADSIDFIRNLGQFKPGTEEKINYRQDESGKYKFLFMRSFNEMVSDFKQKQPQLFYVKPNGQETKIPYDWTIYYLRKKALSQRIDKEELAWIILNFNQKRGYYQLRGEEIDEDKDKQFIQLKVKEVLDTGEKVKGNTLYNVIFENGWEYDRQITKVEGWEGRTKEFIVTTKTLTSGEVKRTYKAVDSEKDWIAIKAKTEQDIDQSDKTIGEYIYDTLLHTPTQKIRGKLVKTIERKFYKEEFRKIIFRQIELQPELFTKELYEKCIEELYPRNEAHRTSIQDKGFEHLFTEDILFYQRPLRSQKSNIAGCQFEFREYKKKNEKTRKEEIVKEPVKAISKSHPLFQEFRLWQWLQNLRIYNKETIIDGKEKDLTADLLQTEDDWTDLFDFLTTKQTVEQKHIIDYFIKKKSLNKANKDNYRWNYVYDEEKKESKKYPCCETRVQFTSRLNKVEGIENTNYFLSEKTRVGKKENSPLISREEQLWHIIYSVKDLNEYKSALQKFAQKHSINEDSFVEHFIKFPPFDSDYGSYSKKAIEKLLPLMRVGKYWDEVFIDDNTSNRIQKLIDGEYDEKIKNRVREKTISLSERSDFRGLPLWLASYVVYDRHSEIGEIQQWEMSYDIQNYLYEFKQHSLRNPIVEQIVTETLRVVKDIWEYYAEKDNVPYEMVYDERKKKKVRSYHKFFEEIHVELGREMKNPADKRKQISQRISENENTNYRIKEILQELMNDPEVQGEVRPYSPSQQDLLKLYEEGIYQNPDVKYDKVSEDEVQKIRRNNNPSKNDIIRYKLWLEQGYISPYTGKPIQLSKLFTREYDIEHIIPQSRYFDNSLSNKIICERDVNDDKGNKTAYEYLKEKGGESINGHRLFKLEEFESHVSKYFKNNKLKLKNLLSEDIPEGFINRQMNDSRYISKLIKGLLSNIVREQNEREATSKKLIPVTGTITSKLKQDWGLNDKWNEIIAPRFKRLNVLTKSDKFGFWDKEINAFRIQVPDEISKGFNKKRIDHRHHALDALVVACTTRNHTHYLSALNAENKNYGLRDKLLIKNEKGDYTKTFQMPWVGFPVEVRKALEETVVSFKQNTRVINKTINKFWSYTGENGNFNKGKDGKPKKKLRKQTKGDSWSIRKSLHKETVSGLYNIDTPKGKIATSVRTALSEIKNEKQLAKITDQRIREVILPNHLKNYLDEKRKAQYDLAFSEEGIEDLNKNIVQLNEGKNHQPIRKVKQFEIGSKFQVGETGNNAKKYVEAAKGTNLFFAVYWDKEKQKRNFETIPLNEVIAHQKQVAHLPKEERTPIQPKPEKGEFMFTLSPNDLVYVPTDEEIENPSLVDFENLNKEQTNRVYKMEKASGNECYFIRHDIAQLIKQYDAKTKLGELSSQNKLETTMDFDKIRIKEICWKLKIDRLGNISKAKK
ncbi:CRISPR-associated protein Csn1 [Sinomicrobium pectinilyticum]|uniref:CRISPR-associated endonuclease Cas9 n=1 Tax=Sinomicrobium pectinilyticum TaxID=1084421 RepID=A0A3N0EFP5_SINP1|nr:type II CRISPR RNA-guided endonuclease Cas9 [Sinomicrobium pectinilyticum]RNL86700.1 CRISPR-associated protein Csn1 [Sinomicrobium pectinilyticum]